MKQVLFILSSVFILTACSEKSVSSDKPAEPSAVSQTVDAVKQEASAAKNDVMQAANNAKEKMSDSVNKAAASVDSVKEATSDKAKKMMDEAGEKMKAPADLQAFDGATQYREGVHYKKLPQPVRTITPGKVEITEVFAYSCGHCFKFEPFIQPWKKTLPDYIEVVQSPAIWRKVMEPHARILYTAKALGVFEQVHQRTFDAIHVERKRLTNAKEIAPLFIEAGIDEKKFYDTFDSFGVTSQVNQASARAKAMRIEGTPELVVDGRFRISSNLEGIATQKDMLNVAQGLAAQIKAGKL